LDHYQTFHMEHKIQLKN